MLESLRDEAASRDEDPYRGVWSFLVGRSWLTQGRIADAIPALREATAVMRLRDPGMMLPWCLAALTQALCAADDAVGARAALRDLDAVHLAVTRNIEVEVGLARAWAAATDGSREEGARLAVEVARTFTTTTAAWPWPPSPTTTPSASAPPAGSSSTSSRSSRRSLPDRSSPPWPRTLVRWWPGTGRPRGSRGRLRVRRDAAARRRGDGHRQRRRRGEGRRATAGELRARASVLADHCGTALTPLLEPISDREALGILTRKEQEVALMAARGMTKREIAAALSVSIRTVGNHINHAYGKLGVSSRDELRAVLRVRYASTENDTVMSSSS